MFYELRGVGLAKGTEWFGSKNSRCNELEEREVLFERV